MKTISQAITMTLGAGMFVLLFAPRATAGCGDLTTLRGPFVFAQDMPNLSLLSRTAEAQNSEERGPAGASLVGMWNFQLVSEGNTAHNPSIPDGAIIDFGYNQIHSDGTEIMNSGGHAPATQNFCLGVWGQTGFLTYEVNHFPLSYNATTGALANLINLREQLTLSPSGDSFTGTFTLDVYDTKGNHVDHLGGNVTAQRVTVDTTVTAAP
jgi:hypothetical protein